MGPVGNVGAAAWAACRPAPPVVSDLGCIHGVGAQNIGKGLSPGVVLPRRDQGVVIPTALHPLKVSVGPGQPTPQEFTHLAKGRLEQTMRLTKVIETPGDAPLVGDF